MTDRTRRGAIGVALTVAGAAAVARAAPTVEAPGALTGHEHDWDWLVGRWNVRHHRLNGRLTGSTDWQEFSGTSMLWLTLGGLGTVDDNVIGLPDGAYRAVGVRAFDVKTGQWAIWWLDERNPVIEAPVFGGFADGGGTFMGDDTLRGRPIKVRYLWSDIGSASPRWEQAFSPDGGATWETNWVMHLTRA